jgi:hypothetical protein
MGINAGTGLNNTRMKKTMFALLVLFSIALLKSKPSWAQVDSVQKRYSIAVFSPLYLDSAFDKSGEYKFGKQFPKYISPGLEFYEGIQMAADSLAKENIALDIKIFDTRSSTQTLEQQINAAGMDNTGLFIAHVTPAEAKQLAGAAQKRNIPFINANLPNDAGIAHNPSLVLLNTTLKTHCEGIYRFLQKNYATTHITIFKKEGALEDRIKNYFTEIEKNTASVRLTIKFVTINDNNILTLQQYLDSTHLNVSVVASFDENFGKNMARQLSTLSKKYNSLLIGMPTWDTIDFTKKEFKGLDIIYSTPFYNAKTDKLSTSINTYFKEVLYSRPSDMVFRGYECLYRFGKLLAEKGSNLGSSIGEKKYRLFTDWDIQPVLDNKTLTIDYFENKKLYFIKKTEGFVTKVY